MEFNIWSQEHQAWWKPKALGYTTRRNAAGQFSLEDVASFRLDPVDGDVPEGADVLVPIPDKSGRVF